MARKRKSNRPKLIRLRGILYLHVAIYIGAILYTWWEFVDLMYRSGFIFNQADVPLPFHAAWTGILAIHIVLTGALSLLNKWRLSRKSRMERGALASMKSDEERFNTLLDELTELRESLESRRHKAAPYRLVDWEDEPDDEIKRLQQLQAEREALKR